MNEEILPDIRNKLTAPKIALDKLLKGEKVPSAYLKLASKELNAAIFLLQKRDSGFKTR
ncbi:MAG: hypothetical protein JNN05_01050 [Candidatus Omnitrophica bacterium]|nr:hypothetical protein [Candidatus Omnitrophota bacterium]